MTKYIFNWLVIDQLKDNEIVNEDFLTKSFSSLKKAIEHILNNTNATPLFIDKDNDGFEAVIKTNSTLNIDSYIRISKKED